MTDLTYNGWTNYETWNVALWINNDEGLYNIALECDDYGAFRETMRELGSTETPDNVAWNDSGLDINELDEMIQELAK
jgi:hypothetical protein